MRSVPAVAVLCLDRALHCISINESVTAELLAVPPDEMLGKRISELLQVDQQVAILDALTRVFEEQSAACIVADLGAAERSHSVRMRVRFVGADSGSGRGLADHLEVEFELLARNESDGFEAEEVDWGEAALRFAARPDSELESAIRECLAMAGRCVGATSARLVSLHDSGEVLGAWSAEGANGLIAAIPRLPASLRRRLGVERLLFLGDSVTGVFETDGTLSDEDPEIRAQIVADGCCSFLAQTCETDGEAADSALELRWSSAVTTPVSQTDLLSARRLLAALVRRIDEIDQGIGSASTRKNGILGNANFVSRSADAFREMTEQMRDGVFEIGEAGEILYASPSFAEWLGTPAEELVGRDPLDFVDQDEHRRLAQIFRPGSRARRKSPIVYRVRSDSDTPRWLEATSRAYRGEAGDLRVVVSTRDVTDREYTRRALERQVELETRVAELSRFFMDLDVDEVERAIQSRLGFVAGLAQAQHSWLYALPNGLPGMELFDWWEAEGRTARPVDAARSVSTYPYLTGLILTGQTYHVSDPEMLPPEAQTEREDMHRRGIRSILAIPIMSGGEFKGCLGFEVLSRPMCWSEETIMLLRMVGEIFYSALRRRRSVQQLRDSQSKLLQAQKMEAVGTLAGGVAHDFNNHLAVMLGNARFVRQEVEGPADVLDAIDDFERAADHCAQLTRSLLAFSRRSPVAVMPVDVADLVEGVEGLIRPLLPNSIDLRFDLGPDLGEFNVDRVQIQQVLVNLLVNARDAMPEGGLVGLCACRRGLTAEESSLDGLESGSVYIVLSVEDEGDGMDSTTMARVFEPFFTTKTPGEGTGLGLAMAYGIIKQSGGAIAVESEVRVGTVFRVYLPALTASQAEGTSFNSQREPFAAQRTLLFEPNRERRASVYETLARSGILVESVETAEAVAEEVRRGASNVGLVIASLPRPDLSVMGFVEALRGGDQGPPILVLTDEAIENSIGRSDVRVLRKSASASDLADAAHALCEFASVEG